MTTINLTLEGGIPNYLLGEDVTLRFTLELKHPDYYDANILEKLNKTLYNNNEELFTTVESDYTLSNLPVGEYNVYYTISNLKSNTVTFEVSYYSEISTTESSYEYCRGIENMIPLIITDASGQSGMITISVKDKEEYITLSSYYDVINGYQLSTEALVIALENLYDTLDSNYTINITYSNSHVTPSSTEFTLIIINQRNTTITYEIINNTPGNVEINITVIDLMFNTPIPDADIQITGDININTTSGIITDNTLSPGNHIIIVQYPETENYNASETIINFNVAKYNLNITVDAISVSKGDKTNTTVNTNETLTDGILEVFVEDNKIATITEFDSSVIIISDVDTSNYNIGNNTVTVKYTGSQIFNNITETSTLTLLKRDVSISAGIINITKNVKSTNLTVTFNETVNDGTIKILLNNNIIGSYTITKNTTTANVIIYNTNIPKSPSNITVKYTDSLLYNDATINTTMTTNKSGTNITIDPIILDTSNTINLTARITAIESDILINEGKIVFKINGKTVKDEDGKEIYAKVLNGIASIEYAVPNNLIGQNITITATYTGTSNYNQESATINTTITAPITTPTITTDNITATSGQKITLTATITDNDKVINNGKVVFKINGKTVKDDNGKVIYAKVQNNIASVEYTIPESMKIGNYTITATYISTDYDKLISNSTMTIVKS
ncbi:MAG: Ig-like domain repeat protein [Methanosphaera sp.]|nr:Ig-like domain repeat protein [Methanosphaera sp.]